MKNVYFWCQVTSRLITSFRLGTFSVQNQVLQNHFSAVYIKDFSFLIWKYLTLKISLLDYHYHHPHPNETTNNQHRPLFMPSTIVLVILREQFSTPPAVVCPRMDRPEDEGKGQIAAKANRLAALKSLQKHAHAQAGWPVLCSSSLDRSSEEASFYGLCA